MNQTNIRSTTQSFAEKIVENEGGLVRYIEAVEQGERCWYFLKLFPTKYSEYKRKKRDGRMMMKEYGEILLCGWGDHAPDVAKHIMHKRYNVAC